MQELALMRPQGDSALHLNILMRIHDSNLVILKIYNECKTSLELIVEARNLCHSPAPIIMKLLGALVIKVFNHNRSRRQKSNQ